MILGTRTHTVGDTKRWAVDFSRWLDNTAQIQAATVTSSSTTLTVGTGPTLGTVTLGKTVVFYLTGGSLNETAIISLQMTDTLGNVKNDSIVYVVLPP